MLTLSDINEATNSKDGDIYSDLYKDVYGFRPRFAQFTSVEEFDVDYEALINMLNRKIEREKIQQEANFVEFKARVAETMLLCNCDRERAIMIIADAEGISEDEFKFYGLESLEYQFNLQYGSIIKWVSEENSCVQ